MVQQAVAASRPCVAPTDAQEFTPYNTAQKRDWAKAQAQSNAALLTQSLGFAVSERLPYVLLQAAADVMRSVTDRAKLPIRFGFRADHYLNTMKVLATAILHYDLAANLVGLRDGQSGKLTRCENTLFADRLNMAPRTVDNCVYSLKRSGLYLSFEQREEKDTETGMVYRGVASIKRLNMALFEMLGLGKFVSVQRAKAKQRQQLRRYQKTPIEQQLDEYRQTDDKVRAKRDEQREKARQQRQAALAQAQAGNRTQAILDALARGESLDQFKTVTVASEPPIDDIPY